MGAFLHDVGKIDELTYERDFAYTDEGQLIGHLVMAVGMLEKKLEEAERLSGEAVPDEIVLRLKHMIVSHHGQYEYGSPKLPMTLEAVALHHLDNLDAKIHSFDTLIRDDPNVDSGWTIFHHSLGRKLFKGEPERPPGPNASMSGQHRGGLPPKRFASITKSWPCMHSDDLEKRVLHLVKQPGYKPVKPRVIAKQLDISARTKRAI